jgi:Colicin-E5 Imm protein
MKLTPSAASSVCREAADHNLVIARIEGGIWHAPGFEARLDCIWDGLDPPMVREAAIENNNRAADFIRSESGRHNAFVLTTFPALTAVTDHPDG